MAKIITCDAHDYFEIVCMRRSQIKITTHSNKKYYGTAIDINKMNYQEVLKIQVNTQYEYVLLTDIKKLEAIGNKSAQHNFLIQL